MPSAAPGLARDLGGAGCDAPVGAALGKIARLLPAPVAQQVQAIRQTTAPAPDRGATRPDPVTTIVLVPACGQHRQVQVRYRSGWGSKWDATVDPWAVVVRHGRWYLICRSARAAATTDASRPDGPSWLPHGEAES
ncbi:MAG: WYL domain-containing protein, partial [Actinomycetota bacterium]|nr:WYL domain-containing protein [Actinomycetota bacterium]